jgi:hypothetical protein
MSKAADFSEEAAISRLRAWCTDAARSFTARRENTPEDFRRKGFTFDELVDLAMLAYLADDLIATGDRGIDFLWAAHRREFGYVNGFVAHIRRQWHLSRGARRKPVVAFEPLPTGKIYGTEETVRHFMRNPFFVRECARRRAEMRNGATSDHDLIANLLETRGFKVAPSAVKNASRKMSVRSESKNTL